MVKKSEIIKLSERLYLSPYQSYIIEKDYHKYDTAGFIKYGGVLYAPYLCDGARNFSDFWAKIVYGRRADLIGMDRILITGERGIKIYSTGFFTAYKNGVRYYADPAGNIMNRKTFIRVF